MKESVMPPDPTPDKDAAAKLKALAEAALKAPKPGPTTSVLASAVLLLLDSQALQASEITALRTRMGMQATEIVERENEIAALRRRLEWQPIETARKDEYAIICDARGEIWLAAYYPENSGANWRGPNSEVYDDVIRWMKLHGEFARLNFPTPIGSDTAAPLKP